MWIFIGSVVLVLIGYLIYRVVLAVIERAYALKPTDLNTALSEFKETAATDSRLKKRGLKVAENISHRYEQACVIDPVAWKDDPAIPEIIDQYKKLLSGKILDPDGQHMPSEFIDGKRNPDYEVYIEAQKKALGKAGKLTRESRRLKAEIGEENLRADFVVELLDMGFPSEVLNAVVADEKLNTYKADQWRKLTKTVKAYLELFAAEYVAEFLEHTHDLKILLDAEKMEAFYTFRSYGAPIEMVKEIVAERITVDQAVRISQLVLDRHYDWKDAIEEVLEEDLKKAAADDLRKKYREMLQN